MASTILYVSPGACSLAPHILLRELGRPFELAVVTTDTGQTRTPAFRTLNAKGRVPVLLDNGAMLTEAAAILFHLAATDPDRRFFPSDDQGLARAAEWFSWLGTVHATAVRMIWRPAEFSTDSDAHSSVISKGREHLTAAFTLIDRHFASAAWSIGYAITLVDPYVLVFFRWGNRMGIDMRLDYPSWTRHAEAMQTRPAVKDALAAENISLWS